MEWRGAKFGHTRFHARPIKYHGMGSNTTLYLLILLSWLLLL
jgi:hypothetical protein